MIIIDFSQIAIGAISQFTGELRKGSLKQSLDLSRHSIISSLIGYKKKYGAKYGEMVIACDARKYWREESFPHYKGVRKRNKQDSDTPWEAIYTCINQIRGELEEVFPWKILIVPLCEADDIFAVLTKYVQENELTTSGIFDEPQEVLLVSSDGDNAQLTQHDGVKQWCPLQKKFLPRMSKVDLKKYMIEHVAKGDTGDGVPNVWTADDFFMTRNEGERQKPVTQQMLDLFFEHGINGFDYLPEKKLHTDINTAKERYKRNEKLVLYDNIPDNIKTDIINHYNVKPKGNKSLVRKYFIQNRCKLLLEELDII